ncbi:GTPase [Allonocardiopsis opalescens]|uniref:GTPase n=1 Tax=Allonocardiopsis opalescens TaxID=1144618 RepID=UPI0011B262B5|nr:GTPase [Allonocardiopsis opalescens]
MAEDIADPTIPDGAAPAEGRRGDEADSGGTGPLPSMSEGAAAEEPGWSPPSPGGAQEPAEPPAAQEAPEAAEPAAGGAGEAAEPEAPEPAEEPRPAAQASTEAGEAQSGEPDASEPDASGDPASEPEAEAGSETAEDEPDDADWRPSARVEPVLAPVISRDELADRIGALGTLIEIGADGFEPELLRDARTLLRRAGSRMRVSQDHTIVALAGGTGSGKSSLFNALCGLEFSTVGVTRPTTSTAHACVWGEDRATAVLDWLRVPPRRRHSRTSALDEGDSPLDGLILLDLPDHDSVRVNHAMEADRLIGAVDLLVWVLDPQKYADAAVHQRYLAEMAGHGTVTVVALNQVDRLGAQETEECLTDLRRLLDSDERYQPRIITTSAVTGAGLDDLREILTEAVGDRRALADRLAADIDKLAREFEDHRGGPPGDAVDEAQARELTAALGRAAAVDAVGAAAETAYERRAAHYIDWPVAKLVERLRGDPLRRMRIDDLYDDSGGTAPVGAQQAEVDNALNAVAEGVAGGRSALWGARLRAAAFRDSERIPQLLGKAVADAVPELEVPGWWRLVRTLHYALLGAFVLGLAWLVALVAVGFAGGWTGSAVPLLDTPVIPYAAACTAATLLLGWLTAAGCRNLVAVAANVRQEQVRDNAGRRIAAIARERVLAPLEQELATHRRFTAALDLAQGRTVRAPVRAVVPDGATASEDD